LFIYIYIRVFTQIIYSYMRSIFLHMYDMHIHLCVLTVKCDTTPESGTTQAWHQEDLLILKFQNLLLFYED